MGLGKTLGADGPPHMGHPPIYSKVLSTWGIDVIAAVPDPILICHIRHKVRTQTSLNKRPSFAVGAIRPRITAHGKARELYNLSTRYLHHQPIAALLRFSANPDSSSSLATSTVSRHKIAHEARLPGAPFLSASGSRLATGGRRATASGHKPSSFRAPQSQSKRKKVPF